MTKKLAAMWCNLNRWGNRRNRSKQNLVKRMEQTAMTTKLLTLAALTMLAVTANAQTNGVFTAPVSGWYQLGGCTNAQTNDLAVTVSNSTPIFLKVTMTNDVLMIATNEKDWSKIIPASEQEQAVKDLVKGGIVCRVIRHKRELGCSIGPGCLVIHTSNLRHCLVCGKEESQSIGEWK